MTGATGPLSAGRRWAAALAVAAALVPCNRAAAYDFAKPITIDRSKIPGTCADGATLTDYPMLFSVTDPDLAHTTSGGDVTDLGGDDVIFRGLDTTTCGGPTPCVLDHEIERYVNTSGELVAWVRIPSVNTAAAASDTVIYLYYGDSTVTTPTENPNGVWNANYVGVWHLNETVVDEQTTGTHIDSTSFGNDGSQNNNVTATGKWANGQSFDGTSDYIDAGSAANLDDLGPLTVSAWINPVTAGGSNAGRIVSKQGAGANNRWLFEIDNTGAEIDAFEFAVDYSPDLVRTANDNLVSYGVWQYMVVTWDGSTAAANVHIYQDGVEVAYQGMQDAGGARNTDAANPLVIGATGSGANSFDGLIDEVRISTSARSACWIAASYNNQVWPDKAVTPTPDPSPNPSDGFYTIGAASATAVELVSFSAHGQDGAVELSWETGTEIDNLGFHVYRSLSERGLYERITASLIPGLGSSPEGARYGYRDVGLVNGIAYYYQLEDIETTGRTELHGPVWATPLAGSELPAREDNGPEDPSGDAGAWIRYGDPEATSLKVLERGKHYVDLELRTGGFWALPDEDGGVSLLIPGFEETQQPGAPALPEMRPWLEAVAGRKVKLAKVTGRDVVAFDGLQPAVMGEPELWQAADGTLHAGRRRKRPGRAFKAAGLYPEKAAQLLGVAFQGDVKKAQLGLSPLRWDRSGGRLLLARRLRLRVKFAGREKDELALGGSHGKKKRGGKKRIAEGVAARLTLEAPGLYGVSYEDLSGGHGRGRSVSVSRISLSYQGEPVAFHVEPAGRRFGPGSTLFFVSAGSAANPYGKQATYELSVSDDGVQMPVHDAAPDGGAVPYYWQGVEQEVDYIYQGSLLTSPQRWFWDFVMTGQTRSYTFPVSALAESGEASLLEVWLQGASDFPADPDHHIRVSVNGYQVGEASWDGRYPNRIEVAVPPGVLHDGENTLALENVADTGARYSLVLLDRYALSYPRRLVASAGALEGRFDQSGTAEVQGLSSAAFVLDTTQGSERWLTGTLSGPRGLSFRAEPGRSYLAVSAEAVLRPEVTLASPSALEETTNRADYLVLGPRAFLEAAQPLLAHRRGQGLETMAVAIEEVYDEFGFGESRPEAVRDFLSHAYHNWELGPRYVLLLGDATYDFKDVRGTGVENHVPPYMIEDSYMWTASDPSYAAVNGDDLLPDLALGRMPVQSVEQAHALIQKLLAWENAGFDLSGRAVLVADNPDGGGDFEADAEILAQTFLAGRDPQRIYLSQLGGATRATIYEAFDTGSSLMSYIGHGAIALWATENVFNFGDVANLAPQAEQPFLMTINCLNGYFHYPFLNSLSEELVKAEGKGAIGAFAPSSLSVNWAARLYHEALIAEITSGRHERLGDALLAAQSRYADSGARPELLRIYQLLADPALRIR